MAQYFFWMNFDRREKLNPLAFGSALNQTATSYLGAEYTEAALTMLAGDWAGQAVLFMGDYTDLDKGTPNPLLTRIREEYGRYPFDEADGTFTDVFGRFSDARRGLAEDTGDGGSSYAGPADLSFTRPRYVINRSKGEYVDRAATCVWYLRKATALEVVRFDPISLLLTTWHALDTFEDDCHGPWVGDDVLAADVLPEEGFADATRRYVCAQDDGEAPVYASDEQIKAVAEGRPAGYAGLSQAEIETVRACLRRW